MNVWIDPKLATDGEYAYSATISDLDIRVRISLVRHTLKSANGQCYELTWSSEKAARGPLGTKQKAKAKELKAELEPQFREALAEAGWSEEQYGFWGKLWTRQD